MNKQEDWVSTKDGLPEIGQVVDIWFIDTLQHRRTQACKNYKRFYIKIIKELVL